MRRQTLGVGDASKRGTAIVRGFEGREAVKELIERTQ